MRSSDTTSPLLESLLEPHREGSLGRLATKKMKSVSRPCAITNYMRTQILQVHTFFVRQRLRVRACSLRGAPREHNGGKFGCRAMASSRRDHNAPLLTLGLFVIRLVLPQKMRVGDRDIDLSLRACRFASPRCAGSERLERYRRLEADEMTTSRRRRGGVLEEGRFVEVVVSENSGKR